MNYMREKLLDFCTCSFVKTSYGYQLEQPDYFSKIKPINIDPKRRDSAMATQNKVSALRAVLGALLFFSVRRLRGFARS